MDASYVAIRTLCIITSLSFASTKTTIAYVDHGPLRLTLGLIALLLSLGGVFGVGGPCRSLGSIDPSLYRTADDYDVDGDTDLPEGHIGRVRFGVQYNREDEKLKVSLVSARNLPSRLAGTPNACDPFVRFIYSCSSFDFTDANDCDNNFTDFITVSRGGKLAT